VMPFSGEWNTGSFTIEGYSSADGKRPWGDTRKITAGFLPALGVRLLAGRLIESQDRRGSPAVAVVDEALARRYWPNAPLAAAVGKRLTFDRPNASEIRWCTVVGVVAHSK